jgi:hypothetical protein
MRISSLVLGFVATSIGVSQEKGAPTANMTRVYDGKDFESYYLDPPYWTYHSKGFGVPKSAHWLYGNHRYVFIDIKVKYAHSHP